MIRKGFIRCIDSVILLVFFALAILDILLVSKIGSNLDASKLKEIADDILLVLGLLKIFFYFDSNRKKVIFALSFLTLALVLKNHVSLDYWHIVVTVFAAFNINFQSIVKCYIAAILPTLFIIYFSAITGIIDDGYEESSSRIVRKIYDLGMGHHSWFMIFWLFLVLCILYITEEYRYRFWIVLLIEMMTAILWLHTGSNTATISVFLVCFTYQLSLVIKNDLRTFFYNLIGCVSVCMPLISAIITILGVVFFGTYGYANMPSTMMNRFKNILYALELYGVNLPFETDIESYNDVYFSFLLGAQGNSAKIGYQMDNLYGRLFIFGGSILFGVYFTLQIYVRYKAKREKDFLLLIIFGTIAIFGISEARAFTNSACIIFSLILFAKDERSEQMTIKKKISNVKRG